MSVAGVEMMGIRVRCKTCDRIKKPHGRSASPLEVLCEEECAGYDRSPRPGCLWPGERESEFGYEICDNATKPVKLDRS